MLLRSNALSEEENDVTNLPDKTAPGAVTSDLSMQTKNVNHDLQQAAQNAGSSTETTNQPVTWRNGFQRQDKAEPPLPAAALPRSVQPDQSNSQCTPRPSLPPKPAQSAPPPYRAPPYPFSTSNGPRLAVVTRGRCPSPLLPGSAEAPKVALENESARLSTRSAVGPSLSSTRLTECPSASPRIPTLSQASKYHLNGEIDPSSGESELPSCRTQAWIEEQKSSFKPVSSLQQRIKSFLHPSASSNQRKEDKPRQESADGDRLLLPSSAARGEGVDNLALATSVGDLRAPESTDTQAATSSEDKQESGLPLSPSVGGCRSRQDTSMGSTLRDAEEGRSNCQVANTAVDNDTPPILPEKTRTRINGDVQNLYWSDYLMSRTSYENMSHNMTTTYNYDKVLPKNSIGRSNQEDNVGDKTSPYKHLPYCAAVRLQEIPSKETPPRPAPITDGPYHSVKNLRCYREEPEAKNLEGGRYFQPDILRDSTDTSSEQYKSSSESGRGTMHSGVMGSKSPVSGKSSVGPSAVDSILDSSLDSDHSNSGNRKSHITDITKPGTRASVQALQADGTCSESFSVTPPLPPLSPPHSPDLGRCLSPESKYNHSMGKPTHNVSTTETKSQEYSKTTSESRPNVTSPLKNRKAILAQQPVNRPWETRNKAGIRSNICPPSCRPALPGVSHGNQNGYTIKTGRLSPRIRTTKIPLAPVGGYAESVDADMTSTTTGLDMDSLLDEADDYSSECSGTTSNLDATEVSVIRKQLEGLEVMYSEILRILGVKPSNCPVASSRASSSDLFRPSRRRVHGSLSSLTGRSSVSRGTHSFRDKRGYPDRRKSKDHRSGASKRLQRLESHVITLARSIAHLSSEMRTQQMLIQELDSLRRDVGWVQEQLQLLRVSSTGGATDGHGRMGRAQHPSSQTKDWDRLRKEVLELISPGRVKKLTKFFGDEPPLLRQFLKKLGYEKYATQFEGEKIGIMELPYLTEDRLQKLGIPMGPRMRILQEAQMSFRQDQLKIYIV